MPLLKYKSNITHHSCRSLYDPVVISTSKIDYLANKSCIY